MQFVHAPIPGPAVTPARQDGCGVGADSCSGAGAVSLPDSAGGRLGSTADQFGATALIAPTQIVYMYLPWPACWLPCVPDLCPSRLLSRLRQPKMFPRDADRGNDRTPRN